MRKQGILPAQISPLDRLAHVGSSGLGALTYEPDHSNTEAPSVLDLDWLASQSLLVLDSEADQVINELLKLNGSSVGARPKTLVGLDPNTLRLDHGGAKSRLSFKRWLCDGGAETTESLMCCWSTRKSALRYLIEKQENFHETSHSFVACTTKP